VPYIAMPKKQQFFSLSKMCKQIYPS